VEAHRVSAAVVSGGTGAIGHALVRLLLEQGREVWVLCRPGSERARFLPASDRLHVLERDVFDLLPAADAIAKPCRCFFHLGWHASYGTERLDAYGQARNITAALDAARLAAKLGCAVFVGAGSQAQYGPTEAVLTEDSPMRPDTAYGAAKLRAEHLTRLACRELGLSHVWARVLSVYGPCDGPDTLVTSLMRTQLRGEEAVLTPCGQLWDFLFAEDAARAFLALAELGLDGKAYCLASGLCRPLRDAIEDFRTLLGDAARLAVGGKLYAPGQRMRLAADIAALREDIGFVPQLSFAEGIARTWRWYNEHPEALMEPSV
jgi:nucleoside-diphosphate-sugar epimerase